MFFSTVRRTSVAPVPRVTSCNESPTYLVCEPTFERTVEGRIRVSGRQCNASAFRRRQQSAFRDSLLELRAELADASAGSRVPPVGTRAEAVAVAFGASSLALCSAQATLRCRCRCCAGAAGARGGGGADGRHARIRARVSTCATELRAAVLTRPLLLPLGGVAAALPSSSANAEQKSGVDEMGDGFVQWPLPDALAYTQLCSMRPTTMAMTRFAQHQRPSDCQPSTLSPEPQYSLTLTFAKSF